MIKDVIERVPLLAALGGLTSAVVCVGACGINPNLSDAQQERDLAARMAWVDKAINVAERHNLAYRVELDATGKPSIGETIDLYLDSGVSARVLMFGNAAAAPKQATSAPADDAPPNEVTQSTESPSSETTAATDALSGEATSATEAVE